MEDWDMWLRFARHFRFHHVPEPLSYKYDTVDSLSHHSEAAASAFHRFTEKHAAHPRYGVLRARLWFVQGATLCQAGEMRSGRRLLRRAWRTCPSNMLYAGSLLAAEMGQRLYRYVARFLAKVLP
jgi:hypothetical protein